MDADFSHHVKSGLDVISVEISNHACFFYYLHVAQIHSSNDQVMYTLSRLNTIVLISFFLLLLATIDYNKKRTMTLSVVLVTRQAVVSMAGI